MPEECTTQRQCVRGAGAAGRGLLCNRGDATGEGLSRHGPRAGQCGDSAHDRAGVHGGGPERETFLVTGGPGTAVVQFPDPSGGGGGGDGGMLWGGEFECLDGQADHW